MCLANSWRSWVICENSWARQFGDLTERQSRDEVIYLKERYERTAVWTDTSVTSFWSFRMSPRSRSHRISGHSNQIWSSLGFRWVSATLSPLACLCNIDKSGNDVCPSPLELKLPSFLYFSRSVSTTRLQSPFVKL